MDKLKKERRLLRSAVTKLVNSLNLELEKEKKDNSQLESILAVLEGQFIKLNEADDTVKSMMLDSDSTTDEMLDEELTHTQEYQLKVSAVRVRVNSIFYPQSHHSSVHDPSENCSTTHRQKTIKYPKIELAKFGGDLKDWLGWWGQFEKIHLDEDLDESDKFTYLIQSMEKGSRAEELIKGYPQSKKNYQKAIEALKNRFGKTKLLQQYYVREVISMILLRVREKVTLSSLYDRLISHLRSLESLNLSVEAMEVVLFPMVESSLPEEILVAWQRSPNFGADGSVLTPPKTEMDFLMDFLRLEIENEEHRKLARSGFESADKKKETRKVKSTDESFPTAAGLFSGNSKPSCVFCDKSHSSKDCYAAQKMTKNERGDKLKKKGACFVCLKPGHMSKSCKANIKCPLCTKRHELLQCPQNPRNSQKDEQKKPDVTTQSNLNCTNEVILQTMMVRLVNPTSQKTKTVRVLIDCGSQRSYLLKKTALDLNLEPVDTLSINHQLFGGTEVRNVPHFVYDFQVQSVHGSFCLNVKVMDHESLCGSLPRVTKCPWMGELKRLGIFVNDLDERNPTEIEFLIGADILGDILTGKIQRLQNGLTATETQLGWAVMGEIDRRKVSNELIMSVFSMTVSNSTVSQLWSLDTLGIRDPVEKMSKEQHEQEALEHFQKTVSRDQNGRYSVRLPWISQTPVLPSNREVAMKRLENTTRKLMSTGRYSDYEKVFNDWEAEGIISVVKEEADGGNMKCHFLPHRAVFKNSVTTPVRPVFDASCKVGRHPSLNECLEKGPNLLDLIPSILLRFRMGKIGIIADIRKAFLMIEVHPEDRDFIRFLWWDDVERKNVKVYRHNRVVFGMNCSPFLLGAVIFHHLNQHHSENPSVVSQIIKSLYVDNLVLAVDTVKDFETVKKVSTGILDTAKMELRQWERSGSCEDQCVTNVLGLKWDKDEDCLFCDVIPTEIPTKITKRVILSSLQKVFDPIGLWSPVLIVPRILMQQAWMEDKNWDDEVNSNIVNEFVNWSVELSQVMDKVKLRRDVSGEKINDFDNYQLHIFGDASKKAYATVVYLRVETREGVKVHLLQAKSRVAPIKGASIPRLELLACTISARLAMSVKTALDLDNVPCYFWSDSTTALSWIKRSNEWGTFVGNRVKEICQLTQSSQWHHIPGIHNPADLPSRGITPTKFVESRWWEGPGWLRLRKELWPLAEEPTDEEAVDQERKRGISTLNVTADFRPWYVVKNNYSSNLRVLAFVFRFLNNTRNIGQRENSIRPTADELDCVERRFIKIVQLESFSTQKSVIEGLRVEKDTDEIIRVKTKITNRQDSDLFRRPILLPNFHPFVTLIIRETHELNSHGGTQLMMAKLREKFWIVQSRRAIKKVIRKCVRCTRFDGKKGESRICPLPEPRVRDARAFEVTGIDLAGPLTLKNKEKVYIVLFTCAVYRAIHLELVESLSTEDFILSFIRFIKRRQRPTIVYTDNGTNFVGAVNLFKGINWESVEKKTQVHRVKWVFNPPSAPWWGGWWERLVRSVKDLLRRMLGFAKLTYVQLETALCEVESPVNHRPLTYVTEDQDDFVSITPAMFLHDLPESEVPEASTVKVSSLHDKKRQLGKLLAELKEAFRSDYLGQLVQRGNEKKIRQFEVGEIVIVEIDKVKKILWPMAKIVELIPGNDGEIRVAKVRTKTGILTRPIQRLVPLEVRRDELPVEEADPEKVGDVRELIGDKKTAEDVRKPTGKQKRKHEMTIDYTEEEADDIQVEVPVVTKSGRTVKKPERFTN